MRKFNIVFIVCLFLISNGGFSGENLITNYSFEKWEGNKPVNWKINLKNTEVTKESVEKINGEFSLCFKFIPSKGERAQVNIVSSDFPVEGGKLYFLGFWAKWTKVGETKSKKIGSASARIIWKDKNGKDLKLSSQEGRCAGMNLGYFPQPWKVGERITISPEKASFACISFGISSNISSIFYLDSVKFFPYKLPTVPSPDAPKWRWKGYQMNGARGKVIEDKDASGGKTLEVKVGREKAGCIAFGPYANLPPGEYWMVWRFKVSDISEKRPVEVSIDTCGGAWVSPYTSSICQPISFNFKEPNKYQEFKLAFINPPPGTMLEFKVFWSGKTDLYFDNVTAIQVREFTDKEIIETW